MSQMSELDLMYRDVVECIDRGKLNLLGAINRLITLHPDVTQSQYMYLIKRFKEYCNEN